ncbi:unnamed protein product, partial [Vitis vinifera]
MISERLSGETSLRRDLEALSVSQRLVRSVSQKLRKKNNRSEGEEEEDGRGVSLRCLVLYGRGGGCKVGAETSDDFGDPSSRRRSNGYCSGEIHALDVSLDEWHRVDADILKGRFLFSVASIQDSTHKGVLVFSALTKSWRKVASMKHARSSPILGISEVGSDCLIVRSQQNRQDRRFPRTRIGGVSDVYEDPHRLSLRREPGSLGSWDEPLDSGEIYDSVSNKWMEIQRLPVDFGIVCSGVVCNGMFYVYSETDKLAGYDIERGFWVGIQITPSPPRVHEYYPKLVSCNGRLFMLSVSWCEGDGQIGRRNKAVRKLWELDLMYLTWTEVSIHPDAPMDWNAAFVADRNLIFGVEMFKIFGQVLDFLTVCDVSDKGTNWSHISRNHVAHELDASSCMTKSMAVLHL